MMRRMSFTARVGFVAVVCWMVQGHAVAQQAKTFTITEPAIVRLDELFQQADAVATIEILSGDAEHYATAVYKARVVESFKGLTSGETIYFGPFISYGIGSEYLAFLHRSQTGVRPEQPGENGPVSYGALQSFYEVMYEGYSIMPVEYLCVFNGKEPSEQCDYGIKINTYQVRVPKTIKGFPPERDDAVGTDKKWFRRAQLLSLLRARK
jgi:hypothetical protein